MDLFERYQLSKAQFGVPSKHSMFLAYINLSKSWIQYSEMKNMSSLFSTILQKLLTLSIPTWISKLTNCGFDLSSITLVSSYLHKSVQNVVSNDVKSEIPPLYHGESQGSVLELILIVILYIYINIYQRPTCMH